MLRWLQKKLPKVATLWAKLCAIAVGAHITLLFLIFFVYKGNFSDVRLEINANCDKNALVVFMPFEKTIKNKSMRKSRHTRKYSKIQPSQPKPKKQSPQEKAPTAIATEKKVQPKKTKAAKKNKETKKEIAKPNKKNEPKKEIVNPEEPKKNEPIIPEPVKPEPVTPPLEEVKPTAPEIPEGIDMQEYEGQNIRYIGQAELDAMCLQDGLTSAITQHWKPPVGVAKNRICELLLVIDWEGKIKDIKVQKPSGSAIYDVSTRTAALATQYPKGLWGKACTVAFKQ